MIYVSHQPVVVRRPRSRIAILADHVRGRVLDRRVRSKDARVFAGIGMGDPLHETAESAISDRDPQGGVSHSGDDVFIFGS